mgnify:CR=1 FL=1
MINSFLIKQTDTIKEALKKLDITAEKVLFVVDEQSKFIGTISDGDIRRYILNVGQLELNKTIEKIYNNDSIFIFKDEFELELAKKLLFEHKIEAIPVIERNGIITDLITWSQAFSENMEKNRKKIDIPVVIMAGGKGTRLEPFTKIFPKALIPVGEKPILQIIIEKFYASGIKEFLVSLNYKGDMIESYFNGIDKNYSVEGVWEKEFLGTAGSLSLIDKKKLKEDFILTNCDIIVNADYSEVLDFHREHNASLTILSAVKHYRIPYGVINFKEKGKVIKISEKPEFTFTINAGVYILNKETLDYIPKDKRLDMNQLIDKLIANKKIIQTYPVNENDYIDIGDWTEFKRSKSKLEILKGY